MSQLMRHEPALIVYTNHRGECSERVIEPQRFFFGTSIWHPEPQWLLVAFCRERGAVRTFAMSGISSWRNA